MKGQFRAVNRYISKVKATSSIDSVSNSGTFQVEDISVGGFTLPQGSVTLYVTADFAQTGKEEIFRIVNIAGDVMTYDKRISVGGYVKPSHAAWASIRMNDVADILNEMSDHIDNFGDIAQIEGTQTVKVWWGIFNNGGTVYNVDSITLAVSWGQLVDNTTNYVHFNLTTRVFVVTASSTLAVAICMGSVVVAGGVIGVITDLRPSIATTYFEIATKLDKAAGLRDSIGLNKTIIVDRTTGVEAIKNVDDASTLDLTTKIRVQKTWWDYSDVSLSLLKDGVDSNLHPIPVVSTMTAPIAVDTFDSQMISAQTNVDSAGRLTETYVSWGSGVDLAMTYVFTASKNVVLNSATYSGARNIGYTVTLKETVSLDVLYTGAWNATATDTFWSGVFLRKGLSYTVDTRWTGSTTYSYTFPSGDLTLTSLTTGSRNPESLTFNYAVANNIPFGITTVSNITTPVSAKGWTISQIQVALRKVWTPSQVVNVELLNSAWTVITGATATIASGTVTTSQANYNVTLGTPYSATANDKLFVKLSTAGSDNSNYYMAYGSTVLTTSGINASTNADANPLFYMSVISTWFNRYIWTPCHPTLSKYAWLCDTTVTNFGLAYLRTWGYSSSSTWLNADTVYYVNSNNTWALTTSSGSWVSIGKTYGVNLVVKMP